MKHHFIDRYSDLDSPIHRISPSVKLILTFMLIVSIVAIPSLDGLKFSLLGGFALIILAVSRIPIIYFARNLLILIPFVALAGVSILFYPEGKSIFSIGPIHIHQAGLEKFLLISLKSVLSLSYLHLFISTTPYSEILKTLQKTGLPGSVIGLLSFIYRYFFIIQDEFMKSKMAAVSRGSLTPRTWAFIISSTLNRSMEMGNQIYVSMKSRGFDGTIQTLSTERFGKNDVVALALMLAIIGFLWAG